VEEWRGRERKGIKGMGKERRIRKKRKKWKEEGA